MKKVNLREYYANPRDRARAGTVAIFEKVTALDWIKIPDLCRAFAQEFESSLLVQPMGSPKSFEVCLVLKDSETSLDEAEEFVDNFFTAYRKTISQSMGA